MEIVKVKSPLSDREYELIKGDWTPFKGAGGAISLRYGGNVIGEHNTVKAALEAAIGLRLMPDSRPNQKGHWYETINPKGIILHECNGGTIAKSFGTRNGVKCPVCYAARKMD